MLEEAIIFKDSILKLQPGDEGSQLSKSQGDVFQAEGTSYAKSMFGKEWQSQGSKREDPDL